MDSPKTHHGLDDTPPWLPKTTPDPHPYEQSSHIQSARASPPSVNNYSGPTVEELRQYARESGMPLLWDQSFLPPGLSGSAQAEHPSDYTHLNHHQPVDMGGLPGASTGSAWCPDYVPARGGHEYQTSGGLPQTSHGAYMPPHGQPSYSQYTHDSYGTPFSPTTVPDLTSSTVWDDQPDHGSLEPQDPGVSEHMQRQNLHGGSCAYPNNQPSMGRSSSHGAYDQPGAFDHMGMHSVLWSPGHMSATDYPECYGRTSSAPAGDGPIVEQQQQFATQNVLNDASDCGVPSFPTSAVSSKPFHKHVLPGQTSRPEGTSREHQPSQPQGDVKEVIVYSSRVSTNSQWSLAQANSEKPKRGFKKLLEVLQDNVDSRQDIRLPTPYAIRTLYEGWGDLMAEKERKGEQDSGLDVKSTWTLPSDEDKKITCQHELTWEKPDKLWELQSHRYVPSSGTYT